jgi:hypothetical protein
MKNKMEHYYQNIQGWFNFDSVYSDMVNKFPSGSRFVEVGCWLGRSACYLGVEIINSDKDIKLDCVDTWLGAPELLGEEVIKKGTLYDDFLKNIEPLRSVINPIRLTSTQASHLYENESLDFVFIDADHSLEGISADLKCWHPKVKHGGILAGHDFDYPEIKEALTKVFGNNIEVMQPNTWIYRKQ